LLTVARKTLTQSIKQKISKYRLPSGLNATGNMMHKNDSSPG